MDKRKFMWLIPTALFIIRIIFVFPEGFAEVSRYLIPALLFYIIWCVDKYE